MSQLTNVLSFDLEHWYTAALLRDHVHEPEVRVVESANIVLDVLRRHDTTATFFTVGELAREHPGLVARVADDGHEVASHGHTHTSVTALSEPEFRREIRASADAIRAATGERPVGFRAPNFSVEPATAWAFDVLADEGFRYDSSVFPTWTPMYGVPTAPVRPYVVRPEEPFSRSAGGGSDATAAGDTTDAILELPLAVADAGLRLPIAGGFYARLLPTSVIRAGIRNLNRRGIPATVYFHPWEFNPAVRTRDAPVHKRFVSFHGIERTADTLDALLDAHEFTSARRALDRTSLRALH